jgi:error-prone DNA polymerase
MAPALLCAKCGCDDEKMIEVVSNTRAHRTYFCNICSHDWTVQLRPVGRFDSIEQLVQRTNLRRDELTTLADVGALNAFTNERRSALWQVERAVRPAGELFAGGGDDHGGRVPRDTEATEERTENHIMSSSPDLRELRDPNSPWLSDSPLRPMDDGERLHADYAGMGLTIGPHPMALRRPELAQRGIVRAADLSRTRDGRRVRVAGMVITRQRPGTAKGFVFLTLEDETGISNVIVRPDLFDRERMTVVGRPFLMVDGILQNQEGVLSVRAERLEAIDGDASVDAHDFY